jgi:hypothetical protein
MPLIIHAFYENIEFFWKFGFFFLNLNYYFLFWNFMQILKIFKIFYFLSLEFKFWKNVWAFLKFYEILNFLGYTI